MTPRGNPSNPMPAPKSGALNGEEGVFMGKNLGRKGINLETDDGAFDPTGFHVRTIPTTLDTYDDYGD